MFLKPFAYERATTLGEACDLLRSHGEAAKVLSGGQSLLPMMNAGLLYCDVVVDISRLEGLPGVEAVASDGFVTLGALVTHAELAGVEAVRRHLPLVAEAARHVGNGRVRNRGTLGGSLAHADPAAEIPLVMTALGARVQVSDGRSEREIPAEELAVSFFSTQLAFDEVLTAVRVPVLGPGWGWSFLELARRSGDFAYAAVAALVRTAGGEVVEARLAVGGVGERPMRLGAVEVTLSGAGRAELAERSAITEPLQPPSDANASAAHRRRVLPVLVRRALDEAFARSEAA
ncbi:MAG: FAD binding domain-containing protein [Acidimicrobiales bacterium]